MKLIIKKFNELNNKEVYEILKARSNIFVIEQKILYLDMDDIDYKSYHMFYIKNKQVIAYLRAYYKTKNIIQFGRVLTIEHGKGIGKKLLQDSIKYVTENLDVKKIYIEAQSYAIRFYEKVGFVVTSKQFFEDGISHNKMELKL